MQPYSSNYAHLQDELIRLDLLLYFLLAAESPASPEPPNPYQGYFLQRQEIFSLLTPNSPDATPNDQSIREELTRLDQTIADRITLSYHQGVYLPLVHLAQLFRLSPFQRLAFLICLGPELDRKYEKIYAFLQDDLTSKRPEVDLIFRLLLPAGEERLSARREFSPEAPLSRYLLQIIDDSGGATLLSRTLKLDDRIVDFITGNNCPDIRLEPFIKLYDPETEPAKPPIQKDIPERIERFLNTYWSDQGEIPAKPQPVFYFYGPQGAGKLLTVKSTCRRLGLSLLTADLSQLPVSNLPREETIRLLVRETILQNAALCLENLDAITGEEDSHRAEQTLLQELFRDYTPLVFILGDKPWKSIELTATCAICEIEFTIPEESYRRAHWESCGRRYQLAPEIDLAAFADKFRFTPGQIESALCLAEQAADWRTPALVGGDGGAGVIEAVEIYRACHRLSNQKLASLAQKVTARYTWEALVLPMDQLVQLHEICEQVRYRQQVFGQWRFGKKLSLGKGLNALFSGPPGCGKTMAAEVIAGALNLELYKIDLSRVVSKYIGETEKNLGRIFAEAETSNAILFFDEADALFGKRAEVKDAHDRFANIETGYLLQKMEEYEGLVILATNLSQNMDPAFLRRMQFMIEFTLPEKPERTEIWRKIFPPEAPLGEIDFEFLAEKLKLAGGNIKNIALRAAFYAAAASEPIGMSQILRAIRREYQKIGKMFLPNDFEPYKT